MKKHTSYRTQLTLLLWIVLFSSNAALAANEFARLSYLYFDYTDSNLSAKSGSAVAAGIDFGTKAEHQVSIEIARTSWSWESPIFRDTPASVLGLTSSGHVTPILVNYRYSLGEAAARFRFYAGASAGATKASGKVQFNGSGVRYGGSVDKTKFSYGVTAGVSGSLTASLSYDVGYRYLHTDGFDTPLTGTMNVNFAFPTTSAHIYSASLKLSF